MPVRNQLVRGAGVLLPISSLPSNYGIGTFGSQAFRFIDFLKNAGQKYWQVLPIGPTSYGDSPYQSFSAFAGNPYFIDLDILIEEGLLTADEVCSVSWGVRDENVDYAALFQSRLFILKKAFFRSRHMDTAEYTNFCSENAYWLDDYCLFMSLKNQFDNQPWSLWPEDIRFHRFSSICCYSEKLSSDIDFWKFCQYKFFEQWNRVKTYANRLGIQIIGDVPIYVALDSADVWGNSELFQLDAQRRPTKVAGVPPDLFSKEGQLWGNPLYDWDAMEHSGFDWWKKRMGFSTKIYDRIRIDHFIGIVRYYVIPAEETTAVNGCWQPGPGRKLTDAINASVGTGKIIAEDLGEVVPEVKKLLEKNGYPGMKVLQFAFDGNPANPHLPMNYIRNTVVYAGTHDNETQVGYFNKLPAKKIRYAKEYLNVKRRKDLPGAVLRAAYASVADTVIFQAQDILFLPAEARMNYPSTVGTNWRWRLKKGQLTDEISKELCDLARIYGR
ncbi:4-alpha-glucanotransferase [Caproiciproducens faecalis]|uniref:4-alpha-glucanotransferase n=1 Tax=Caproiciproducens faecalis TaxID=2820301 RepID=A0ABS7DQX2_9FIRM|nr:4-alpha-glucanotransferase [Caproiciproducens faecalis]MBW7573703.1 4-alpha-glucanotransferase [Caproiciproducens faecalis]